jgi:hypothetical protein
MSLVSASSKSPPLTLGSFCTTPCDEQQTLNFSNMIKQLHVMERVDHVYIVM